MITSFSIQADAKDDYQFIIDTIILGDSLKKTDINCDDFINNFKEFALASEKVLEMQKTAGELELKDMRNEVQARSLIDLKGVFQNLGENIAPNLAKCEHRLLEIIPYVNK
jgi:hypothetical protein